MDLKAAFGFPPNEKLSILRLPLEDTQEGMALQECHPFSVRRNDALIPISHPLWIVFWGIGEVLFRLPGMLFAEEAALPYDNRRKGQARHANGSVGQF